MEQIRIKETSIGFVGQAAKTINHIHVCYVGFIYCFLDYNVGARHWRIWMGAKKPLISPNFLTKKE